MSPDPRATERDSKAGLELQTPADAQRLLEENRALRELLAAQVSAQLPRPPSLLQRLAWWLITAPGTALVRWRNLLGREDARPITGKRVGWATLTVLYTFAVYGALVLLVVYWSTPNSERTGATAASPVRLPLQPLQPLPGVVQEYADAAPDTSDSAPAPKPAQPSPVAAPPEPTDDTPARSQPAGTHAAAPVPTPVPTLRITEIPAEPRSSWLDALKTELARCAELSFFDRPDCAWAARKQYCEPNHGWGAVKECPARP